MLCLPRQIAVLIGLSLSLIAERALAQTPAKSVGGTSTLTGATFDVLVINATVVVTSPSGDRTSFDVANGAIHEGIPGSTSWGDSIDDDVTGKADTNVTVTIHVSDPASGSYHVRVTPRASGPIMVRFQFAPTMHSLFTVRDVRFKGVRNSAIDSNVMVEQSGMTITAATGARK